MPRQKHRRIIRLASMLLAVSLLGLTTACGYKSCRDGESGRFRCDPSATSVMPRDMDGGRPLG